MTVSTYPLVITTTVLPVAFNNYPYYAKVEIQTPITDTPPVFSLESGVLPPNITLNANTGVLSGVVLTDEGQFPIAIRVTIGNYSVVKHY